MSQKQTNRWVILIASIIINLCIGSAYAWSVFQKPLIKLFGWSTAEASLAFTINLALVPLAMIVAGKIQDKKGPKIVSLLGGIVFGVGIFLAGSTNSITTLYLTYGLLGGLGIGMAYACTIANTVKWFPDKRGLAGGLTAAGFGSGAIVFAPIASALINQNGVLSTFRILGIVFLICIVLAALVLKAPEAGWKPEGWNPPVVKQQSGKAVAVDKTTGEMLKTPKFYILWGMYTIGCISGLMIIGHASPIAQEKIGLSPQVAAVAVSIIAIANTSGRLFWGTVSDKIGRYVALVCMYVISSGMLILLANASNYTMFILATCGIALSFGGFMGIFPSITADNFGPKNLGVNYGVIFTAFGLAAIFGPRIAAVVKESSGGEYGNAFIIASVLNVIGMILTFVIIKMNKAEKSVNSDTKLSQ